MSFESNHGDSYDPVISSPHDSAAYKAYLPLSNGSSREFYGLDFLNNSSGITVVKDLKEEGRYYNLQGQPVAHPTKGIYIHNGKKVIVK